jgi:hypothetical protein
MISVNKSLSAAVYNEYCVVIKHKSVGTSIGRGLLYQCSTIFRKKTKKIGFGLRYQLGTINQNHCHTL